MATKMGWFDVPLGAETRQLVSTSDQAIDWINTNFGKPLKYYNSAADMRAIWKAMLTNGIVPEFRTAQQTVIVPETQLGSSFSITMLTGLSVQVNPGIGWIDGAYCIIDEPVTITLGAGAVTDITLRLDLSGEDVAFGLATKTRSTGTPQEALIRTGGVYELGLHSIEVPPGTTELTSAMITDLRLDVSPGSDGKPCCGMVGSLLQPDITELVGRTLNAFQQVLDSATPPDGNLASGIFLTDEDNYFDEITVEGALNELYTLVQSLRTETARTYAKKSITTTAAFLASGWGDSAPYSQTLSIAALAYGADGSKPNGFAEWTHSADTDTEAARANAWGRINYFEQGNGTLTAICLKKAPTVDLPFSLLVIG